MERYAKEINLEFIELDAEPRLTHWDAFMLGLAQDVAEVGGETDASAFAEWA